MFHPKVERKNCRFKTHIKKGKAKSNKKDYIIKKIKISI